MNTLTHASVTSMSVSERIQLVEDIWDTIAEAPEQIDLTNEDKAELDRRLDAYHRNPDEGVLWAVARKRIVGGR